MITLINGNVQSPAGLVVPDGSISFQLNVDATIIAAPYGIVLASETVIFQFDANGNLQSGAKIYSNAELEPQNSNGLGTYYLVTFYDANGARINKNPMWWQFPEAANSTVDISSMTPYAVGGGNIIFYPVLAGGGGGGAGGTWNTTAQSTTYSAAVGDMVLADTTGGGFTVTFPAATASTKKSVRVKKVSSDGNTITVASADLIDGAATQSWTSQDTELEAISDGITWWIA